MPTLPHIVETATQRQVVALTAPTGATGELCEGVPRPMAEADVLEASLVRVAATNAVADVRVSRLGSSDAAASVVRRAPDAYDACSTGVLGRGDVVTRRSSPFVSLAGTAGANLYSEHRIDEQVVAVSRTLAITRGPHVIEVRLIATDAEALADEIDPVAVLDAVEQAL